MNRFIFFLAVLFSFFLSAPAGRSEDWESTQAAFRNIRSVKADFLQNRYLRILKKPILSEGRFFFDVSDFLRWEYIRPLRSVMIQNGDAIQLYEFSEGRWRPGMVQGLEARQMVMAEIRQWLQGRFAESKVFSHRYTPGPPPQVSLTPREGIKTFISGIVIVLSATPGVIDRVEIDEPGNSRTSIRFRNVEINSRLPAGIFEKP
jgi:outer membrane lipoprotein-sorting protein